MLPPQLRLKKKSHTRCQNQILDHPWPSCTGMGFHRSGYR
jgi:hypothetical protein